MKNRELKDMYNRKLNRYYNGCQYIKENCQDGEKWIPIAVNLIEELGFILEAICSTEEITKIQMEKGFKL